MSSTWGLIALDFVGTAMHLLEGLLLAGFCRSRRTENGQKQSSSDYEFRGDSEMGIIWHGVFDKS